MDPTTLRGPDDAIIGNLTEIHGQWVLEYEPPSHASHHARKISSRTRRAPQKASAILWHKRLGYPGPAAIEHLAQQAEGVRVKGITTVECDSCGRAKSKRQIRGAPRINTRERLTIDFHAYETQSVTKEKS